MNDLKRRETRWGKSGRERMQLNPDRARKTETRKKGKKKSTAGNCEDGHGRSGKKRSAEAQNQGMGVKRRTPIE